MSVINQMLRDLDKLQGKPEQALVAQPVFARAGKTAGWRWLLPLLLALLLLWQWQPQLLSQSWHWWQAQLQPAPMQIQAAQTTTHQAQPALSQAVQPDVVTPEVVSTEVVSTDVAQVAPALTMPAQPEPAASRLAEPVATQSMQAAVSAASTVTSSAATATATVPAPVAADSVVSLPATETTTADWQPAAAMAASSLTIEQLPDSPELQLSQLQQRAQTAQANQQLLQAAALWQQYLQLAPERALPYEQLAALWWQQQQWAELEQLLAQARARQIQSAQLQLQQARLAASQQQWAMVLTMLSAVPMTELLTDVLPLQAQAQQQLGDYQAALGSYQQWSQLVPDSARAWLGLGLVYDQLKQTTAARAAYQQALALGGLAPASQQFIQQRLAQTE